MTCPVLLEGLSNSHPVPIVVVGRNLHVKVGKPYTAATPMTTSKQWQLPQSTSWNLLVQVKISPYSATTTMVMQCNRNKPTSIFVPALHQLCDHTVKIESRAWSKGLQMKRDEKRQGLLAQSTNSLSAAWVSLMPGDGHTLCACKLFNISRVRARKDDRCCSCTEHQSQAQQSNIHQLSTRTQ
jgi:hypothetical protein